MRNAGVPGCWQQRALSRDSLPRRDPQTGKTSCVFSCFNRDQELDRVDFGALSERLRQNSLQEKLTAQWIGRRLKKLRAANA